MLHVIGIESTAHTFSVSVVSGAGRILSNQKNVYAPDKGSGIHPLEASRSHAENAPSVIRRALDESGLGWNDISAVCYSKGPGLGPCLRVGAVAARTIAARMGLPLVPVNHAVGHIELGCLLTGLRDPVVLLVSGGHTMVVSHSSGRWRILGETLDLTLGQLFDQFGRHSGLSSPCGPVVESEARKSSKYLPLPYVVKGNDVSFSGMLTAAKSMVDDGAAFADVAFSIQETAFAMMTEVTERAVAFTGKREAMIVGGVAANVRLSRMMTTMARRRGVVVKGVPPGFSGDCGAQIAWTGYLGFKEGEVVDLKSSEVRQSWRLDTVDTPWRN